MAIIDKNILGEITGKIGNLVIRKLNGKTVIALRPAKYKASQSTQAKFHRNRFAVTVKFAKYINSIKLLSQIWAAAPIEGTSAFNRILKYNLPHSYNLYPSENNIIIPSGYNLEVRNILYNKEKLNAEIIRKNHPPILTNLQDIVLFIVMVYYHTENENLNPYEMDHSAYQINPAAVNSNYSVEINLNEKQKSLLESYSNCNLYFAEVAGTGINTVWSSSICKSV